MLLTSSPSPAALLLASLATQFAIAVDFPDNTHPEGADVWCGKTYKPTDAPYPDLVERGWLHAPTPGTEPRLEFTCRPRLKPYVQGLDATGSIIIEAKTNFALGTPLGIPVDELPEAIFVTITTGGTTLAENHRIAISDAPSELEFDLTALPPLPGSFYNLTCHASLAGTSPALAVASTPLYHLPPNPYNSTTVQLDTLTTHLLLHSAPPTLPTRFFPLGFYTSWSDYLAPNLTVLADIKAAGYTLIHPVPSGGTNPWESFPRFLEFLDACLSVGLWVQYDLRHSYTFPDSQIRALRSHPAILLWYTADEPDGHNAPFTDPLDAYHRINTLDGYHPVSLATNCANYFFDAYSQGADILMPDAYSIGVDTARSNIWDTECTRTYGCCGCDSCSPGEGALAERVRAQKEMSRWVGRASVFWGVAQGFGGAEYWTREPSASEILGISKAVLAEGVGGLVFWIWPTGSSVQDGGRQVAEYIRRRDIAAVFPKSVSAPARNSRNPVREEL